MPWCAKCRVEYVDGIATCTDCGRPLVDYDPTPTVPPVEGFGPMLLLTVATRADADIIEKKLVREGIEITLHRPAGTDRYDIYVTGSTAYRKARALLELEKGSPGTTLLITAADKAEADGMEILLGSYNIAVVKSPAKYGGMVEVLVADSDFENARELLELDAEHLRMIVEQAHGQEPAPWEDNAPPEEKPDAAHRDSAGPEIEPEPFHMTRLLVILAIVVVLTVLLANPVANLIRGLFSA